MQWTTNRASLAERAQESHKSSRHACGNHMQQARITAVPASVASGRQQHFDHSGAARCAGSSASKRDGLAPEKSMGRRCRDEDTLARDQWEPASEQPGSQTNPHMGLLPGAFEGRSATSRTQLRHLYSVGSCQNDMARPTTGCVRLPALQGWSERSLCSCPTSFRTWYSKPGCVVAMHCGACTHVYALTGLDAGV